MWYNLSEEQIVMKRGIIMEFKNKLIELFIPNKMNEDSAIKRTTHMAIGAHQDDLEIMAYHGVSECFQNKDNHFTAVVVTNGSGSARDNIYKDYSDQEMIDVRKKEQKKAAVLGEYNVLALLNHKSSEVKNKDDVVIIEELKRLLEEAKPQVLYTHNLADKHDTHIGVVTKVIKALRLLEESDRPKKVYGCEVWRALDWVNDNEKEYLDVSKHPNLSASLVEVFDSQIIGGKRYDKATVGRRLANATFSSSHVIDTSDQITYAMDLTPLVNDPNMDIITFITDYINRFKDDVVNKITKVM